MNRRGFVLLTVLWVVVILGAVAAAGLAAARSGSDATRNRIALTRAGWAREACLEILQARFAADPVTRQLDSIDLGRSTWCRAALEDPSAKLDLNLADGATLRLVLANDSLVDALLDWRDPDDAARPLGAESEWYRMRGRRAPRNAPLMDLTELHQVRGFENVPLHRVDWLLTTRGTNALNLNAAPVAVLATVPGLSPEALAVVERRRSERRPLSSADELASFLSSRGRHALYRTYQDFLRAVSFSPGRLVGHVEGWIEHSPARARMTVTLVPVGSRLAVVRREVQ